MSEMVTTEVSEVNKLGLEDVKELQMLVCLVLSKGFSSKPALVAPIDTIRDRLLAVSTKVLEVGQPVTDSWR